MDRRRLRDRDVDPLKAKIDNCALDTLQGSEVIHYMKRSNVSPPCTCCSPLPLIVPLHCFITILLLLTQEDMNMYKARLQAMIVKAKPRLNALVKRHKVNTATQYLSLSSQSQPITFHH